MNQLEIKIIKEKDSIRFHKYSHPLRSNWGMYFYLSSFTLILYGSSELVAFLGFPFLFFYNIPFFAWLILSVLLPFMMLLLLLFSNRLWYNEGIVYHSRKNLLSIKDHTFQLSEKCIFEYDYYSSRFQYRTNTAILRSDKKKVELPFQSIDDIEAFKQELPYSLHSRFIGTELLNVIPETDFEKTSLLSSLKFKTKTNIVEFYTQISILKKLKENLTTFIFLNIVLGFVVGLMWIMDIILFGLTSLSPDSLTFTLIIPLVLILNLLMIIPIFPDIGEKKLKLYLNPSTRELGYLGNVNVISHKAKINFHEVNYNDEKYKELSIEDNGIIIPLPFLVDSELTLKFAKLLSKEFQIAFPKLT